LFSNVFLSISVLIRCIAVCRAAFINILFALQGSLRSSGFSFTAPQDNADAQGAHGSFDLVMDALIWWIVVLINIKVR
jgi:hypothetical protein